jgi:hypothetical protein
MSSFRKRKTFLAILLIFLLLRLPGLGSDITNSDAIRWHRRSTKFLDALKQQEFVSTYQHYQPGITLMWINSVVKQASLSYQRISTDTPKALENSEYYPTIHGSSKAAMVLVLLTLLIFQLHAIKDLFGEKIALYYGLLVTTEPFLIGIDRWFHLTSFETFFAFSSFLMLLLWKKGTYKYSLQLSALFFALAVYSKLTAAIIAPILLIIFLSERKSRSVYKPLGNFSVLVLAIFVILLPALWVDPKLVLSKFYSAATTAVTSDIRVTQLNTVSDRLFYPLVLGFKLSPLTLALFFGVVIKIGKLAKDKNLRFVLLYFLTYITILSVSEKKIDRYTLALFPPILLMVSVFISSLKRTARIKFLVLLILFNVWVIFTYHPVYSAYYSPLFGGAQKALDIGVFENSGEFFAQAAQYLNGKEGKLTVAIPNNIDAFTFHFRGHVQTEPNSETNYMIWSHDIDRKEAPTNEKCANVEKTFGTNKFPYVYVLKCD